LEKEINDIDDLIGKVLAGEATPEEQSRLEAWTRVNVENQKYLEQIKAIFEKAASNTVRLNFDTDAAWKKVKSRLRESGKEKPVIMMQSSPYRSVLRIAAGIIFFLGVGIFAYQWFNKPTQTLSVVSDNATLENTLPDGSTAFLNKKSSISYEYVPLKKLRKVKLKGEGFFEVKHEEEKPFVIEADEVLVRDIGTAFNVKAYPESDTVVVTVKTGEVQIYTLKNEGLSLKMGETGIYRKSLKEFTRLEKADTNVLAYKTGVFSFNNSDLKSVINKVSEVYNVTIRLENPDLASCRLTVNFNSDTVDTIVDVIAETLKLTVTRNGNEILLSGAGCK
jgi:transmembrane sensor